MKFHFMDKVRVIAPDTDDQGRTAAGLYTVDGKFPERFYGGHEGYILNHIRAGGDGSSEYQVWFKNVNEHQNLVMVNFHESNLELVERWKDQKPFRSDMKK